MRNEEIDAAFKDFASGSPVPVVEVSVLRQLWAANRSIAADPRFKPSSAVGLGAYARYGFDASSLDGREFVAAMLRVNLLSALVKRGSLSQYLENGQPDEAVFSGAATFPCTKDDVGEALVLMHWSESPPEVAEKEKGELRREGFDPESSRVEGKFLDWLRPRIGT